MFRSDVCAKTNVEETEYLITYFPEKYWAYANMVIFCACNLQFVGCVIPSAWNN